MTTTRSRSGNDAGRPIPALAAVLRGLLHGDHGAGLPEDLDDIDTAITRQVTDKLTDLDNDSGWAPLASPLHRILDGDRVPGLADGLDPVSSAVVITIVSHLPPPARRPRPGGRPASCSRRCCRKRG
jgi:hypothetical protein